MSFNGLIPKISLLLAIKQKIMDIVEEAVGFTTCGRLKKDKLRNSRGFHLSECLEQREGLGDDD